MAHSQRTHVRQTGFTLLEVMIAMAVFAIVSIAVTKSATATIQQTRRIEEKTIGYWLAHNQLSKLKLSERHIDSFPPLGRQREEITMINQDWNVLMDIESTDNADIRRLEISVSLRDDDEQVLASLTGFIGKY